MERARGLFSKFLELMKKPELRILPGQLAFFLVLSLIPLIALIGTIASALSIPVGTIRGAITGTVPEAVADIIISVMSAKGLSFNVIIFFILFLYSIYHTPYRLSKNHIPYKSFLCLPY